jgi:hypothetical protein
MAPSSETARCLIQPLREIMSYYARTAVHIVHKRFLGRIGANCLIVKLADEADLRLATRNTDKWEYSAFETGRLTKLRRASGVVLREIFERFLEQSPVCVMQRAEMENVSSADKLNAVFYTAAEVEHERELLFSTLVEGTSLVVCRITPSINAAYVCLRDGRRVTATRKFMCSRICRHRKVKAARVAMCPPKSCWTRPCHRRTATELGQRRPAHEASKGWLLA